MKPFKFTENRVWRAYQGGMKIDLLRNAPNPEDGHFPEDWVASIVEANNPQHGVPQEGISTAIIGDKTIRFDQLVDQHAAELLGQDHVDRFGKNLGFLTKILDSAIRLPLQAHPDPQMARNVYHSDYGKTEAWIVLGTREINGEEPYLILGFNDTVDQATFKQEGLAGEMPQSLEMVHRHPVKAGDVIMLPGGLVHAIGPGVFLIEIMEPTDLVTQPECYCGQQKLEMQDRFGSVSPEDAMNVFHFTAQTKEEAWRAACQQPTLLTESDSHREEMLLDRNVIRFFGGKRLKLDGTWQYANTEQTFCAGIVTEGNMEVVTQNDTLSISRGDTFFMPFALENCEIRGQGEVVFALPPL